MLTSLTTFAGLTPLVFFERSVQAQFLVPMAISLSFGVMFATLVTLVLVPALYVILEDIKSGWNWLYGKHPDSDETAPENEEAASS
jgi:predicted RND superfamily exporter protein